MNGKKFGSRGAAFIGVVLLMMIMVGCAASPASVATEAAERGSDSGGDALGGPIVPQDGNSFEEPAEEATEAPAEEGEFAPANPGGDAASGANSTGGSGGSEADENSDSGPIVVQPTPAVGYNPPPDTQFELPLQAGEIDDNEEFSAYLQYQMDFQSFLGYPVQHLDVTERHVIRVINPNGQPVLGADVSIYDQQQLITVLHTPATGLVYFFPRAYSGSSNQGDLQVTVEKDQVSQTFNLRRDQNNMLWEVTLEVNATQPPVALDVLFLIDTTGSMQDEITQLKDNILSISAQISALPGQPDVRFGLVHYRDRNDVYVVESSDFTRDVQDFQQVLNTLQAGGGGDDPESLQQALAEAIHGVSWRGGDTVQLIFVVADAPPHLDYDQDYPYATSLQEAATMGIKIHPIASRLCRQRDNCSSERRAYQEQAEYIFRQMAQYTGGHYVFLAYEDTPQGSGEPGTESHVSEDDYTVQDLDALVIRLITDELAALDGNQQQ